MKVLYTFVDKIAEAEMRPADFFMVEAGWFHAYCHKINNATQKDVDRFEPEKHVIPISRFERCERRPEDNEKHFRDHHLHIYTPQNSRKQPKHSKNMEIFLNDCPAGSMLIPYWVDQEQRSQRDVIFGRMALYEIREDLTGWAFEILQPSTFGMCFQHEGDAMLFAAMMPAIRDEMREASLGNRAHAHRKLPW